MPPKDPDDPYSRLLVSQCRGELTSFLTFQSESDEDDNLDCPTSGSVQSTNMEHKRSPKSMIRSGEGLGKLGSLRTRKRSVTPKAVTPTKNAVEKDDDATASEDEGLEKTQSASPKKADAVSAVYCV
jgi:hypothetical protein